MRSSVLQQKVSKQRLNHVSDAQRVLTYFDDVVTMICGPASSNRKWASNVWIMSPMPSEFSPIFDDVVTMICGPASSNRKWASNVWIMSPMPSEFSPIFDDVVTMICGPASSNRKWVSNVWIMSPMPWMNKFVNPILGTYAMKSEQSVMFLDEWQIFLSLLLINITRYQLLSAGSLTIGLNCV